MKKALKNILIVFVFLFAVCEIIVFISAVNVKRYLYPAKHNFYEISTRPVKALSTIGGLKIEPHLELHYVCDFETGYGYLMFHKTNFYVKLIPDIGEKIAAIDCERRERIIAGVKPFSETTKKEVKGYRSEAKKSGLKFYLEELEREHYDLWKGELR